MLERKGRLRHRVEGRRHIYAPVQPPEQARRAAWSSLTGTFFGGSPGKALIALLGQHGDRLDDGDLDELSRWVAEQTRRRRQR